MKYLSIVSLLIWLSSATLVAQCSFTVNGQSGPFFLCEGDLPATLAGTPAGGTFSGPGVIGNIFNPINLPGTFNVTYVANGCNVSQIIAVAAVEQDAQINPFPEIICATDEPITFTGNVPTGVFTVQQSIVLTNGLFDPSLYPTSTPLDISYTYQAPNGCTSADHAFITILPTPQINLEGFPSLVCQYDSPIELPNNLIYTYSGTGIVDNVFTPSVAGSYTVTVTAGANNCTSSTTTTITVSSATPISIAHTNGTCANLPDTLYYDGVDLGSDTIFTWQIPSDAQLLYNRGDTIVVDYQSGGEKIVSLNISNSAVCIEPNTSLTLNMQQLSIHTIEDTNASVDQSITLETTYEVSPTDLVPSFSWSPDALLNCSTCASPELIPTATSTETIYVVTATLPDNGCVATDSVRINPILTSNLFIPNIFTPNGDGENDNFLVFGISVQTMDMQIFDRWGSLIFQTNDTSEGWDGSYRNAKVNAGVYIYLITITNLDGTQQNYQGDVTLVY